MYKRQADNWALKATAEAYKEKGNHIITTKICLLYTSYVMEKGKLIKVYTKEELGEKELDDVFFELTGGDAR